MSYTNEIRKDIKSYLKQKCENVYYLKASDSSSFPYIVFSVRSIGEGKVLELDIWDRHKDTTRIENLVDEIEEMFTYDIDTQEKIDNIEKITILRAVHKDKDSREQFERRTHKRLIDIKNPSKETIDALTHLDLPSGVDIDIKL